MIEILKYNADLKNSWDVFIDKSKNGTFMLKRDYVDYHADRFTDFSLMFYEDGELIAVMPASLHGEEIRSHGGLTYGGIISDINMKQHRMLNCVDILKDFLRKNNIKKIIYKSIPYIYHKYPSDEDMYAFFINEARLFRRDVSSTIDLSFNIKLPKGRKSQIARAKREGVVIENSTDFDEFIAIENSVLSKRHGKTAIHTANELRQLKEKFPDNIHLKFAIQNGIVLAAILLFEYENCVHTQYMASNDLGREIGALDLLISSQIEYYKNSKKYFDFGISTENEGKELNMGLSSQKESFGGRAVMYDFYEIDI